MTSIPTRRLLPAALGALLVLLQAGSALALDKDDILRLHEAGLDAGTIVNVIRGTTEELELTADDVDELEAAGVPPSVIAELRLRLGIGREPSGTGDIQRELEEQQRLEQERLRLEQERREQERQSLRQEMDAERARETTVETGFQGLRQARRYYDDGDYMASATVYNQFLEEVQPAPGTEEWYAAKFGLVRSLHRAGLRSAIRADALELALMGADWEGFPEVVRILRDIVNDTGFANPRISELSNEVVDGFGSDFVDEFHYFLGRFYYSSGDYQQALNHLETVRGNGDFGARAAFLSGVILINPEMGENRRAVRSFEQAVTAADPEDPGDREVMENAYLALARVAYQVGNFGGALYYYSKVGRGSQRRTTALFEAAWTYFLSGDMNRALGNFQSLESPYHDHRYYPDLFVLEAAAYLYSCNIDEAHEAVATFENQVGPLREEVDEILASVSAPSVFYTAVVDPRTNREAGDPSLPDEALRVILADADFFNLYQTIQQLERELTTLRPTADRLGERGERTVDTLEAELTNKQTEAGLLIRDILYNLSLELEDWWFRAQEVEIEIGDLEARYLETILSRGEEAIVEGSTLFVVADDWQYWPWEGEYWLDEVGNYRANLITRCPDDVEF